MLLIHRVSNLEIMQIKNGEKTKKMTHTGTRPARQKMHFEFFFKINGSKKIQPNRDIKGDSMPENINVNKISNP